MPMQMSVASGRCELWNFQAKPGIKPIRRSRQAEPEARRPPYCQQLHLRRPIARTSGMHIHKRIR